jgi:hypothetical protein
MRSAEVPLETLSLGGASNRKAQNIPGDTELCSNLNYSHCLCIGTYIQLTVSLIIKPNLIQFETGFDCTLTIQN